MRAPTHGRAAAGEADLAFGPARVRYTLWAVPAPPLLAHVLGKGPMRELGQKTRHSTQESKDRNNGVV